MCITHATTMYYNVLHTLKSDLILMNAITTVENTKKKYTKSVEET